MKKAVYYARVSTSLQEEKGTIDSQKHELIKQIKTDGNILVKEYIDNGWSGGRLDRPALDELRSDLKSDLFDVIYFLDSDRIARDVTYQNIIISEILKCKKEIIIKGKNYIHNPENKFTLTVLGAVNELEKAKIVERLMRGRREKARRGAIVDGGGLFGYTYIKKTDNKDGYYVINEKDAEVIKFIFQTYANTDKSITGLIKILEEKKIRTSSGNQSWGRSSIRRILMNTSYYGLHYFNKEERLEAAEEGIRYAKNNKTITRLRDKIEWIPVKIPAIINKELFDRVQEKLKRNYKFFRSPDGKYILSGLVKCGLCSHTYTGVYWSGKKYYRCNYREKMRQHTYEIQDKAIKCTNKGIKGELLENLVLDVIKDKVLQPSIIKKHIDILKSSKEEGKISLKNDLEKINKQLANIENKKQRILDLYADNGLSKENYKRKIEEFDNQYNLINRNKEELVKKLSFIENRKVIKKDINYFCKLAKKRFAALDLKGKRFFLQQIIEQIIFMGDRIKIIGYIPILATNTSNINYLPTHCSQHSCYWFNRCFKKV